MKKIKRLLALFASLAILTEGGILTSCSGGGGDGSDDDAPSAKLIFSGNNFNIDVSGEITDAEVSVKLSSVDFNETAMAAAADADISEYITVTPSAESDISITSIKLAEAITDKKVAKVKLSAKAGSNSVSGTLSFVIKGSILSSGKDLKVSKGIPYAIGEVGGDDVMGFLWTTKDAGLDGTTKASSKALEAKAYGPVTVVLDGTGTGVLITDVDGNDPAKVVPEPFKNTNTFGYVRLNAGGAGGEKAKKALKFKVPKTTTKISVYAKSGSSKGNANVTISDAAGTVLHTASIDSSDYKTVEYTPKFTEDTLLYLFNDAAEAGLNLKAIYVDEPAVELSTIEVTAKPEKTEYALNDELNTTGLKIKATYSNGKSKTVTGWEVSGYDKAKEGEQTITVSYKEGEITKTATFTVTVKIKALVSIAVKTNPTKTAYLVGDKADLSGLVLTLTYDDKSESTVEYTAEKAADFTSDFDSSTAAESKEVKVTYGGKTTATGFTVKITAPVYFTALNFESFATGKYKVEANESKNELAKQTAADGEWEFAGTSSASAEIKSIASDYFADKSDSANIKYVAGDKTYTKRLSLGTKDNQAYVQLKVGAGKEVQLRIDACSNSQLTESKLRVKGAAEEVLSFYWVGTRYVKVTGDTDGFVKLTISGNNAVSLLGIYVVKDTDVVAKTEITLPGTVTNPAETKPVFELSKTSVTNEADATVTITKKSDAKWTTYKVYTDGSAVVTEDTPELTYEYSITSIDGKTAPTISGTTITVSTGTSPATYKVVATGKAGDTEKTKVELSLEVKDATATGGNGGSVNYVLTPADISTWTTAKTALTDITTSGAKFCAGAGVTYDTSKLASGAIKLGGYAQKDGKNCIQFTTTKANAKVTVKFFGDGDSSIGRFVAMIAGNAKAATADKTSATGAICDTDNKITVSGSDNIVTATLTTAAEGLYSLGGAGAIFITSIEIEM